MKLRILESENTNEIKNLYVAEDRNELKKYMNKVVKEFTDDGIIPTLNQIYNRISKDHDFVSRDEAEKKNKKGVEVVSGEKMAKNIQNLCSFNLDEYNENIKSGKKLRLYISEKVSDKDYSQSKTGKAYKVFRVKNGKLYPPMVANVGGADTPVGVWLDAEEGEFAGLSKTGRPQVKSTGSGSLAYRPGWHLGDVPRAKQFDRTFSWKKVDVDPDEAIKKVKTMQSFINTCAKASNVGNIYYVGDNDSCFEVVDNNAPYFPYDFIWAECEYVMNINYQDEADEQGYMRTKPDGTSYRSDKYQHSLAGLPKLPKDGYYKYRTNPNPDTVPWVITGAMKVTKLLDDNAVAEILGGNAPERQGGNKTLKELGL